MIKVYGSNSQLRNLYVVTINESNHVRQSGHLPDSRTQPGLDLKALYQPATELISFSELCQFTCKCVPLINIFGSRHTFRPLLYLRDYDVLLTTETPITFLWKEN